MMGVLWECESKLSLSKAVASRSTPDTPLHVPQRGASASLPPLFGQERAFVKVDFLRTFLSFPGILPSVLSGGGLGEVVSPGIGPSGVNL